ncbi:zinc finger protein ZPR1-like [Pecten maximus]|uniref:zinc finger protein ZPR1-like n=1 Tax=Pecten maximus TaxID=6579 RepID=UPI0014584D34|nr:zinc finger protein ZPR1-like [Pecten maximus]XP_033758827.1 zinc finger protein ZPR1-like [Pecten maximus]
MSELDKPLFRDLQADDDDPEVTEIESLCLHCRENGTTRLFLTKIPFFREVILSSFECGHCGMKNCELQPGGAIQDHGVTYTLEVKEEQDLNRQIVQTEKATVSIPSLEFEAPPSKGVLTTVEGIIDGAVSGLALDQPTRMEQCPEIAAKINDVILKLTMLKTVEKPFTVVVDDPTGNSFVENPHAPKSDPNTVVKHYTRTSDQDTALGIMEEEKEDDTPGAKEEVMTFNTNCPQCSSPCSTHMKMVEIPHFKEVIIMATNCDVCGARSNEVKSASGIEPKGCRIKLKITDPIDMSRDVLKSETSSIAIPEMEFESDFGTLGGKFTTLEGLIQNVKDHLNGPNSFMQGDSSAPEKKSKLQMFCNQLDKVINGEMMGIHFVLDDPAGNSYLQNVYAPDEDPELEIVHYERNYDQNEVLGLNDMKTEGYQES